MDLGYVRYAGTPQMYDDVIVPRDEGQFPKCILSPISVEVVNTAIGGGISVVFSMGPLQLSPLLGAIIAGFKGCDVLVGIPRKQFATLSRDYQTRFLSIHDWSGRFFYEDILWCIAEVNIAQSGFTVKEVVTRPKHGRRTYKNEYDKALRRRLQSGKCLDWPRIMCVPVDAVFPDNILGNNTFTFEKETYELKPFSPSFVIMESVNERLYSVDPVIALLESLDEKSISGVIHFSWPYSSGAGKLLAHISELNKERPTPITTLHLGKRYCLEMAEEFNNHIVKLSRPHAPRPDWFIRSHQGFSDFSIEGENWSDYYPFLGHESLSQRVTYAVVDYDGRYGLASLTNLIESEGPFDRLMEETRSSVADSEEEGFKFPWKAMIVSPPFFDSFVLPKETKVYCQNESGEWRPTPLVEALRIRIKMQNPAVGTFASLCAQMDDVCDYSNYIQGISTFKAVGKPTAIMDLLVSIIRDGSEEASQIVLCNYGTNPGFTRAIAQRIVNLLETIRRDPSLVNDIRSGNNLFRMVLPNGQKPAPAPITCIVKGIEYAVSNSGQRVEVAVRLLRSSQSDRRLECEKRLTILLTAFDQLNSAISSAAIKHTILVLPGPIPIFSFKEETPVATKGIDALLKPYQKIIVFAFPGENLARCLEQMSLMDEFTGPDKSSDIAMKDLGMSLMNAPDVLTVGISNPREDTQVNLEDVNTEQDPLDATIRSKFISRERERSEIRAKTLEEIWESVSRQAGPHEGTRGPSPYSPEDIEFEVQFIGDMHIENIRLNPTSYIRIIEETGSRLCLAENLKVGEEVAFLKSDVKESLDNYFIRNFSESRDWTLEDVFEPFTCLSILSKVLSEADFGGDYEVRQFSRLHWLSPSQRKGMFTIVKFLLSVHRGSKNELIDDWRSLLQSAGIWTSLIDISENDLHDMKWSWQQSSQVTPDKLYLLARANGMVYDGSSFRVLLNQLESGEKRYYFQSAENLLAIGRLLENQRVVERYAELTDAGKAIRVVLELEGFSISRVLSDKINPLNDMDIIVRDKMMRCKVIRKIG